MHKRPAADKFMKAVRDLRSRNASDEEVRGAGWVLYPDKTKDAFNRARLLRACRASRHNFIRAEEAYESDANIVQIVAALDTSTLAGAPKGNLNARGKRRDDSLWRINGAWHALSRGKQDEFLRIHNLKRIA